MRRLLRPREGDGTQLADDRQHLWFAPAVSASSGPVSDARRRSRVEPSAVEGSTSARSGGSRVDDDRSPLSTVVWHDTTVDRSTRWHTHGLSGATVWLTGLSGSGKSTIANAVAEQLLVRGRPAYVLDGDNLRHGLNADLGFSAAHRAENVRRVGEVARLIADAGLVALVPVISPYRADRDRVRHAHEVAGLQFVEVFVDTPIDVCEQRDPKGLYRKARAGELTGLTGIDDPYEPPLRPEIVVAPADIDAQAAIVVSALDQQTSTPL
jgi:bifunctional enzyme CysN/CysC